MEASSRHLTSSIQALVNQAPSGHVLGVGVDLLDQTRIERVYQRFPDRFSDRLLTSKERQLWQHRNRSVNFLAKQFAAKEAILKALGTGLAKGIHFQMIEVLRDTSGQPTVCLSQQALQQQSQLGGDKILLSLTDELPLIYACALIVK